MLYCLKVTAPPNTPITNPTTATVTIEEDFLLWIGIYFPPGHMGLTGVSLWYGNAQIWPRKEYEWVRGDDIFIQSLLYMKLPEKRAKLTVRVFNEDDTYDHTVYIYIEAISSKVFFREQRVLTKLLQMFRNLWGI